MLLQHLANGLLAGSIIALVGTGFLIVYRTNKFFHFAHGVVLTLGAYTVLALLNSHLDNPLFCVIIAIILMFGFGLLIEALVYQPLRRQRASNIVMLIAGIGIYTLMQNTISLIFGDDTISFRWWSIGIGQSLLGVRVTTVQLTIFISSCVILTLTGLFMKYSTLGKKMKAVANDTELAQVIGINVDRVFFWTMGIGSMLAAISGILIACDVDMTPTMGMQPMMMGLVAVIIGSNTILGTACGALLLGMAQHIGIIWLPTKWQDAIAFFILLVFLIFRPQGFFGKQTKSATV